MSSTTHYDAAIIGSGQAGSPLASAYAKAGKKVMLIERAHVGGCCINEGCTPTKTMIASGRVAYLARRAGEYGVKGFEDVSVDMSTVRQRKRDIVESFRGGSERRVSDAGVDLVMGEAKFLGPKKLAVKTDGQTQTIEADEIFINTGARPAKPRVPGIEGVNKARILDSTSIQELDIVPEHLIVLGGGYIALEFGQLFRRLGSEVTVIQRSKQLLPREDGEVAAELKKILEEDGVRILLQSEAKAVSAAAGEAALEVKVGGAESKSVAGSHLLVAIGRTPNTDTLDLEKAGVETTKSGFVTVNGFLETSVPHVYALGDVKGGPAFTHVSYDDFRIIQANLLSGNSSSTRSVEDRLVSYVAYTDPQLGHVGLHESEARQTFPQKNIQVAKMPMAYVARALETAESRGLMKAVVDAESKKILGFTCLGLEGGEIMSIVQMAMLGGMTYEKLQNAIFAHPSLAESLNNLWGFLE